MRPTPFLFRPLQLRSVTVKNRIMVSPMCQYSCDEGVMNHWHLVHLGARAAGGAGIVCTEATHVEARGRITPYCAGLWNDTQRDAMKPIVEFIHAQDSIAAIQLAHAGRKASTARPWDGGGPVPVGQGGWPAIAPSAIPFQENWATPAAMTRDQIAEVRDAFAAAARRSREAGFRIVEVHAAHGYLLNEFLSPLSNRREDEYGGSFANRTRLLLEVIESVRSEWPAELPLFVRISSTDWVDGGWTIADSIELARLLHSRGDVDLIDCSSGGLDPRQAIPLFPGYQLRFATAIKNAVGVRTGAVGLIRNAELAESIIANEQADLIIIARAILADPAWPLRAAQQLKAQVKWPVQYERARFE